MTDVQTVYLSTLAVIQPARIQDIERNASILHGQRGQYFVDNLEIRAFHGVAREGNLILTVRRGLYALSPSGAALIRTEPLTWELDNRRLFLIKARRKRIM